MEEPTDWVSQPSVRDQIYYLKSSAAPQGYTFAQEYLDDLQLSVERFFKYAYGAPSTISSKGFWEQADLARRYSQTMSTEEGTRQPDDVSRRKILEEMRTVMSLPGNAVDRMAALQKRLDVATQSITESPDFSLAEDITQEYKTSLGKGPSDWWGRDLDTVPLRRVVDGMLPDPLRGSMKSNTEEDSQRLVDAMRTELDGMSVKVKEQRSRAGRYAKKSPIFQSDVFTETE